jgi:hypothetical protein
MATKEQKLRAGHYEVQGETLAKFEFFEAGWNPYQRYLDVDKVDFILRRQGDTAPKYREVQVKFGTLFEVGIAWEKALFDLTSWRFFNAEEFFKRKDHKDFFVAYVLAHPTGYDGDIFVFPVKVFHELLSKAVGPVNRKTVWISRSLADPSRWYFRIARPFKEIESSSCVEVTEYRRNFLVLRP